MQLPGARPIVVGQIAGMGVHEHKKAAPRTVACAVVTISDTRTVDDDTSGAHIRAALGDAGHRVTSSEIIRDDAAGIVACARRLAAADSVEAVIMSGGTGVSPRDNTYEALTGLLTRRIDGFGELFRHLSFEEIGAAAMLSRAVAGVLDGTVFFALPGSTAACRLALERLILPELGHVVHIARPSEDGGT